MESCTILYATQTGRAKACARRTARILRETTSVEVLGGTSFDELEIPFVETVTSLPLQNHFFLLFVSTTGDGVQCDTIQNTWKSLLKKSLQPGIFANAKFALFCLGDRAYGPQFCAAGRKLAVRLMQLGMTTQCEVGYGDDNTPNGGVFADLDRWIQDQLLMSLENSVKIEQSVNAKTHQIDTQQYTVTKQGTSASKNSDSREEWQHDWCQESYQDFFSRQAPITAYHYQGRRRVDTTQPKNNNPLLAQVESNKRLTASDWDQNTRHLCLIIDSSSTTSNTHSEATVNATGLPYLAGDIATTLPSNSSDEVERFIKTLPQALQDIVDLHLQLEYRGSRQSSLGGAFPHWPRQCTLRGWLTYCADIHAPPEREDLRALSQFGSPKHPMHEAQRDKLISLSETSASALYVDYILREKRCWTDVLYDFDSFRDEGSKLTLEALLTLLPPIRPRDFSIASSPSQEILQQKFQSSSTNNFGIELCVAVVEGKTPFGRAYHGLCSHYLWQLVPNKSLVRLWIRPGSFAGLPLEANNESDGHWFEKPVLCIGAGTGVAPLRSLLLEREAIRQISQTDTAKNNQSSSSGEIVELDQYDNLLVFGCRKRNVDYYYEKEWKHLHDTGRLLVLTAFSREQARKVYVQQLVKANGDAIMKYILEKKGAIYVAGNPSMARYTREELIEATSRLLGEEDDKKANLLFKKMQASGRFSVEAWS